MIALKKQIFCVLLNEVVQLNGDNTEEGLSMIISEKLMEEKLYSTDIMKNVQVIVGEKDGNKIEENGVYIYCGGSVTSWKFIRYNTIAEAVREAIGMVNAVIIHNGKIINYDSIDSDRAYYIENGTGKIKVVNL